VPVLSGVVSWIVQFYYAYRLRIISGSKWLGCFIVQISVVQGAAAIITGVRSCMDKNFLVMATDETVKITVYIWTIGSVVCDVTIALSMTIVLLRSVTGISRTHKTVTKLVRLVVETGCLTAFAAILTLVLFAAMKRSLYFITSMTCWAKLYSNSLLVIFNNRIQTRFMDDQTGMEWSLGPAMSFSLTNANQRVVTNNIFTRNPGSGRAGGDIASKPQCKEISDSDGKVWNVRGASISLSNPSFHDQINNADSASESSESFSVIV